MRVLVTGGTGNLGRTLKHAALAAGHTVRIMSRLPPPQSANDVEWVQADIG